MSAAFKGPNKLAIGLLWLLLLGPYHMQSANAFESKNSKQQKGAALFITYCSGCHTLRYMPYQRMRTDLSFTLLSSSQSVRLDEISMPKNEASRWFGKVPPDLSLSARERGESWLYAYLTGFYADKKRPFGANNLVLPDVAMPNVLAPLQGEVHLNFSARSKGLLLTLEKPGLHNEQAFDEDIQDLVAFLAYVAEPALLVRYRLGLVVIVFLCFLLLVSYLGLFTRCALKCGTMSVLKKIKAK